MTQEEEHGFITGLTAGIDILDSNNNRIVDAHDKVIV